MILILGILRLQGSTYADYSMTPIDSSVKLSYFVRDILQFRL